MHTRTVGRPVQAGPGRGRRALGTVLGVVVSAVAIVGLDPALVGLSTTPGLLHVLAFRGISALGLVACGVIGLLTTRIGRRRPGRPWRRFTVGLVLLAVGLGQGGIVIGRGWAGAPSLARADLVVVSLNTLGGAATPAEIATLVEGELKTADAAMVSLPETTELLAQQTADLLAIAGYRFQVFASPQSRSPLNSTTLLIDATLGPYRQVPAPRLALGEVMAEPISGSGPILAAVHPGPPMLNSEFVRWQSEVTTAISRCRDNPDSVVAGDFNSTVDHAMFHDLGPCFDAATRAGRGAEGTWPSNFPSALAAPIDHVLINGGYSVLGTRTQRVGGSDHRALIARLARVKG